jgi:hypothetical protein
MTTTEKKLEGAIDSTADAAKEAAKDLATDARNLAMDAEDVARGMTKDAKGIVHKIGKALKDGANEVATVAGQTLETVGRQMKDTTKDKPASEK